ncbi:MAG: helix-turn-helix transcriptional regulator [Clostridia bacterium]|nr:helix-turn-helix transcriptional regulator [Clostridia bacterium]
MEDHELFKSFSFTLHSFEGKHYKDNSGGAPYHVIGYLYCGKARFVSEKGTVELKAGDLFYVPKGCRYHSYWEGKKEIRFDSFAFDAIPQQQSIHFCLQKVPLTDELKQLHNELAKDRQVSLYSISLLYRLLDKALPNMRHSPYKKTNALVYKIANFIKENPEKRSDEIARNLGVSESTLYHTLKQGLNKTPNLLRQEAKCQQAINLLTCTNLSVEQISIKSGFSSASYMRKCLRAVTGKTPLQIRKSAQDI